MIRPEYQRAMGSTANWTVWAASFAVWTLIYLLAVTESAVRIPDFPWQQSLRGWAPGFFARAVLTPFALAAAEKFLISRTNLWRMAMLHAASGAAWCAAYTALTATIILLFWPRTGRHADALTFYGYILTSQFLKGLISYWAVIGVGHALIYYRRSIEAEANLKEARLESLRRQLNPHFLFNTLNTISILIDCGEAKTARGLLVRLSELLRSRLADGGPHEVPLSDELALLDSYLAIEQARFGERLQVDVSVDEHATNAMIPPLLLQPIVENAIHHGVAKREEPGSVRLRISRRGPDLLIEVHDNGPGLDGIHNGNGVGLANTRARLDQLYPGRHRIEMLDEGNGVTVILQLPMVEVCVS